MWITLCYKQETLCEVFSVMRTFKANMAARWCNNYIQIWWLTSLLLVSQLAPKYPWRQRHSLGRTHTSFSLQVKFPSQRADGWRATDDNSQRRRTGKTRDGWVSALGYVRVRHSFPSCAHPPQHTNPSDLRGEIKSNELEWEEAARQFNDKHTQAATSCTPRTVTLWSRSFNGEGYKRFDDTCAQHMDAHKTSLWICIGNKNSLIRVLPQELEKKYRYSELGWAFFLPRQQSYGRIHHFLPWRPVASVGFLHRISFMYAVFEGSSLTSASKQTAG